MSLYTYTNKKGKFYGVRFRVTENGKYVNKNLRGFKTQAGAKHAEYEYKEKLKTLKPVETEEKKITFQNIFELYRIYAINNLSHSSIYEYFNITQKFLLPVFGETPVKEITKRQLTEWQDSLSPDFSYKYKNKIKTVLSAIFTFAMNRDYIQINPVTQIERIRKKEQPRQLTYWTKQEFDTFIEKVDDPLYKALFFFLYVSGCRKGEAFALRWTDINFQKNSVNISKSITKKGELMAKALGKSIDEKTKNKKTADIFIPKACLNLINELPRGEYVFGCDQPLSETTVSREFKKYTLLSGVKPIRIHDLRHSCAALLISSASDTSEISVLYSIAARLRDSVDQILQTYGHLFPSRQNEIVKTFNNLFPE